MDCIAASDSACAGERHLHCSATEEGVQPEKLKCPRLPGAVVLQALNFTRSCCFWTWRGCRDGVPLAPILGHTCDYLVETLVTRRCWILECTKTLEPPMASASSKQSAAHDPPHDPPHRKHLSAAEVFLAFLCRNDLKWYLLTSDVRMGESSEIRDAKFLAEWSDVS